MSPVRHESAASGVDVALGSGRGSTLGVTQPGADTRAFPGIPGEVRYGDGSVPINVGRPVTTLRVTNTGDRPVTVGSHYHFAEANDALEFDRDAAWGQRLNILSGALLRFDPGAVVEVQVVPFVGDRIAAGFRGRCGGPLDG